MQCVIQPPGVRKAGQAVGLMGLCGSPVVAGRAGPGLCSVSRPRYGPRLADCFACGGGAGGRAGGEAPGKSHSACPPVPARGGGNTRLARVADRGGPPDRAPAMYAPRNKGLSAFRVQSNFMDVCHELRRL